MHEDTVSSLASPLSGWMVMHEDIVSSLASTLVRVDGDA